VPAPCGDEPPELAEPHPGAGESPPPSNEPLELVVHGIVNGLIPVGASSVAPIGMLGIEGVDD
jgi:hypothetical protein